MPLLKACRRHLTYANITASLALFIALGGVSYAAIVLPARSVGNVQLRDGAVSKRVLSSALQANLSREGARGARGSTGPAGAPGPTGPAGPAASPIGIALGGDLAGTFPNPTLRANAVASSTVNNNTLTGDDIAESSLGIVPAAQEAQTLAGIGADDFVQGGGTLWRGNLDIMEWITPADGQKRAIILRALKPDPDTFIDGLQVGIYCSNNTEEGTGATAVLANWGPGAFDVLIDTGDGNPRIERVEDGYGAYSNRLSTEHFFNETRRVVFQGVRENGQAFFVSVIVQHQDDACRGAVIGHEST